MRFCLSAFWLMILSVCSCTSAKQNEVEKLATYFLNKYYSQNFKVLHQFSTDKTKALFLEIESCPEIEFNYQSFNEITSISEKKKDTAIVKYNYLNSGNKIIENTLNLIRVDGIWKVDLENKNSRDLLNFIYDFSVEQNRFDVEETIPKLSFSNQIDLESFLYITIEQINHPKLVVGYLDKESFSYYNIVDEDNFDFEMNQSNIDYTNFNCTINYIFEEDLEKVSFKLFLMNKPNSNKIAFFNYIESILTKEYGEAFDSIVKQEGEYYSKSRWFVKGGNQLLELNIVSDYSLEMVLTQL